MDAEQMLQRQETVWKPISERFEETFAEKPRVCKSRSGEKQKKKINKKGTYSASK